jgi:hypothetical protein
VQVGPDLGNVKPLAEPLDVYPSGGSVLSGKAFRRSAVLSGSFTVPLFALYKAKLSFERNTGRELLFRQQTSKEYGNE